MKKNQLKTISSILLAFAMIIVSLTPTFAIEANDVTESPSKGLTVTAASNLFPEKKVTLSPNQKTIKVTYVLQTQSKDMLDFQWFMHYDSNVLKPTDNTKKSTSFEYPSQGSYMFNKDIPGEIGACGTNLSLYNSTSKEIVIASAEFEVIDPSATETTVDLDVQVLRLSKVDPDTELSISKEEVEITNFGLNQENYDKFVTVCKTDSAPVSSEETTVAPTTEEATTVAPTTEEPTEVPTTEEATTAPATEPTTVAPTTEPTTEPAPAADPIYVVAGTEGFAGVNWIGDPVGGAQNVMTKDGDLYTKTFTATPAGKSYQIKVVKNVEGTDPETGDTVWNQTWIGISEQYDVNFTFDVTDTCDVTVTFNPATNEINVTGDNVKVVTEFEVEYITAVGNGFEGWLNGENWKIDADSNKLEMVSDKVYKITYKDVTSSDYYVFKFAANGSWAANWGLPAEENGAPVGENYALTYNGENMVLNTVALGYEEGTLLNVTLTLDLTNFDYPSKQGAIARIEVTEHTHTFKLIKEQKVTCTEDGYKLYKCSDPNCGLTKIESIIRASGHNYEVVSVVKPTCTEKGYTLYRCAVCGNEKKDNYVDTLPHNYEIINQNEATCTAEGFIVKRCSVCQKLDFVTIPKIVHRNFVNSISCDKCGATLESSHNGTDDSNSTWILKYDNAKSITITFSEDSKIAQGTDYIYILDYNHQVVAELTGSEFAGKSYTFKSDILYISKATSQPFTGYGFKVVSAVANYGVIGDINLDNSIDVKDSTLIQKFSAMLIELDKTELALADANGDGRVDVKDVTIIQKYCVNLTVDSKIGSKLST